MEIKWKINEIAINLIDNPIAVGLLKCNMSWDLLTEKEAEELLQATYQNPMIVTIKAPSVPRWIT